jgi:hypothetical protein
MDGLPLTFALAFGRPNTPVELGRTQVKSPWLVGAPGGRTILVAGGARDITEHRTIESCIAPTGTCTTIVDRPGAALDPAVSVDGTRLAFVHDTTPPLSTDVSHRYAGRTLWVSDLDGSHAGEVTAAGTGIASPRWTSDGRILYERDRALWIVDPDSGEAPARLAASIGTGVPGSLGLPDVSPYINGDIQRPQWEDIFDFVSLPHAEK